MEDGIQNIAEGVVDAITTIVDTINPGNVDFGDPAAIFIYIVKIILIIGATGFILYAIINVRKFFRFLQATFIELRKIDWLSRQKTTTYSIIVLLAIIISTLGLLGIDQFLLFIRSMLI